MFYLPNQGPNSQSQPHIMLRTRNTKLNNCGYFIALIMIFILLFNDIHISFSFSSLPTYPISPARPPEKQLINLQWPVTCTCTASRVGCWLRPQSYHWHKVLISSTAPRIVSKQGCGGCGSVIAHAQLSCFYQITVDFQLVVQKLRREFTHAQNFLFKIPAQVRACTKFPIQNSCPSARMRGFSSRFLDNQLEIDCNTYLIYLSLLKALYLVHFNRKGSTVHGRYFTLKLVVFTSLDASIPA